MTLSLGMVASSSWLIFLFARLSVPHSCHLHWHSQSDIIQKSSKKHYQTISQQSVWKQKIATTSKCEALVIISPRGNTLDPNKLQLTKCKEDLSKVSVNGCSRMFYISDLHAYIYKTTDLEACLC